MIITDGMNRLTERSAFGFSTLSLVDLGTISIRLRKKSSTDDDWSVYDESGMLVSARNGTPLA